MSRQSVELEIPHSHIRHCSARHSSYGIDDPVGNEASVGHELHHEEGRSITLGYVGQATHATPTPTPIIQSIMIRSLSLSLSQAHVRSEHGSATVTATHKDAQTIERGHDRFGLNVRAARE